MKKIKELTENLNFILLTFLWIALGIAPAGISTYLFITTNERLWYLLLLSYLLLIPIMEVIIMKSFRLFLGGEINE